MADPRFFTVAGPFSVAEIAHRTGAAIGGAGQAELLLRDVSPLDRAGPSDLSWLDNRKYLPDFRKTGAGAVFALPGFAGEAPKTATLLLTEQPYRAYAVAAQAFYPDAAPTPGIAPGAVVDRSARLGEGAAVEANAVIGANAEIGPRCLIGANSVIGPGCVLGADVRVGANVSVSHALIGARVRVFPGARIGQDGFGFAIDPKGFIRIPQVGRVIIEDDVEIGANTTIDRGSGSDTVIGAGTMIDNLVQIGHNVQIGRGCVLIAQVGISGSTRLGDQVMIGGQGGLIGHLTIGSGARIGAQAGVMRDVPAGETVMGSPAAPMKEFFRQVAVVQRLARNKGDKGQ
jgi:UDP-3-O-[3-hydroxymyristoyl] glucosamine N-acyltransferase